MASGKAPPANDSAKLDAILAYLEVISKRLSEIELLQKRLVDELRKG